MVTPKSGHLNRNPYFTLDTRYKLSKIGCILLNFDSFVQDGTTFCVDAQNYAPFWPSTQHVNTIFNKGIKIE